MFNKKNDFLPLSVVLICWTISVYELIKKGYLPALKLGSFKIRRSALLEFLEKYEGQDLTDLTNVKELKEVK